MGRVAEVISTDRDAAGALSIRVDPGGGAAITAPHFADSGDDSAPLRGDFSAIEQSAGAGSEQVTGYHDPNNAGVAAPGEKRTYARDSDGVLVGEIWMKGDGEILIRVVKDGAPVRIVSTGPVTLDSPDVRLSDSAGAQVARVGDIVVGAINALSTAPGSPIAPGPPIPGGGVPFAGSIVSGSSKVKA